MEKHEKPAVMRRVVTKPIIEGNGKTRSQIVGYVATTRGYCGSAHTSPQCGKKNHAELQVRQIVRDCPDCIAVMPTTQPLSAAE